VERDEIPVHVLVDAFRRGGVGGFFSALREMGYLYECYCGCGAGAESLLTALTCEGDVAVLCMECGEWHIALRADEIRDV